MHSLRCSWLLYLRAAGAGYSWFVRHVNLRWSLLCFFSGTCLLALSWLLALDSFPDPDPVSTLFGVTGAFFAFTGGFAIFANLVERRPPVDRHRTVA